MSVPTLTERIEMHGTPYATRFEKETVGRIARLMSCVELAPNASVVDFGCGNALLLDRIHDKVRRYVGVDFSPVFIEVAKRRGKQLGCQEAEFHCGSIQEYCAANPSKFDACFALDLSEHVPDDEWEEIVQAMFVCLKPGGTAYLHTPNLEFFVERMKASNFILKQFPEHVAVRNPEQNMGYFIRAGFESPNLQFFPHYNILKWCHPLSYLPGIGRFFRARLFMLARKPDQDLPENVSCQRS